MLFNSYEFIFGFLPACALGFFLIARFNARAALFWLLSCSLFFYGWWSPRFLLLLLASTGFNYLAGRAIARRGSAAHGGLLTFAVTVDLLVLAFFKYSNFFIEELNRAGAGLPYMDIVLPAGISFFTFTQIAYLVDARRGEAREYDPVQYALFVSWFPHLIAGPVLHHKQMMPQFGHRETFRPSSASLATGLTIFTFGLAKKVLLADQFALYANPVFDAARDGVDPGFVSAWAGVLAYALQLYFDFSGYSDMAIGLSRIFNVKLPLNFNSPYKAESIIDFWRRWHMTLSAFLRDYLYFSLGGNRKGPVRRHVNLLLTMILGGMWHGAGWGFLLWGTMHGLFLVGNHALRALAARHPWVDGLLPRPARILATFLLVVLAWVAFRATSFSAATRIWQAMAGGTTRYFREVGAEVFVLPVQSWTLMLWIGAGLFIVWALPNTQQLLARQSPACDPVEPAAVAWPFSNRAGLAVGALFGACVLMLTRSSEFLYFQF